MTSLIGDLLDRHIIKEALTQALNQDIIINGQMNQLKADIEQLRNELKQDIENLHIDLLSISEKTEPSPTSNKASTTKINHSNQGEITREDLINFLELFFTAENIALIDCFSRYSNETQEDFLIEALNNPRGEKVQDHMLDILADIKILRFMSFVCSNSCVNTKEHTYSTHFLETTIQPLNHR